MPGEFDDFHDRFVAANANLDFIAYQFADVLRNLMRASVSNDPGSATYKAGEQMNFVAELLSKTDEKFGFAALFKKTIELVAVDSGTSDVDDATVDAAKSGVKFLVERSCDDSATGGRTSQRRRAFLDDIRRIEEARAENRRKYSGNL